MYTYPDLGTAVSTKKRNGFQFSSVTYYCMYSTSHYTAQSRSRKSLFDSGRRCFSIFVGHPLTHLFRTLPTSPRSTDLPPLQTLLVRATGLPRTYHQIHNLPQPRLLPCILHNSHDCRSIFP